VSAPPWAPRGNRCVLTLSLRDLHIALPSTSFARHTVILPAPPRCLPSAGRAAPACCSLAVAPPSRLLLPDCRFSSTPAAAAVNVKVAHLMVDLCPEEHQQRVGGEEQQPREIQCHECEDVRVHGFQRPAKRHHRAPRWWGAAPHGASAGGSKLRARLVARRTSRINQGVSRVGGSYSQSTGS
jgi:hypothetical protein